MKKSKMITTLEGLYINDYIGSLDDKSFNKIKKNLNKTVKFIKDDIDLSDEKIKKIIKSLKSLKLIVDDKFESLEYDLECDSDDELYDDRFVLESKVKRYKKDSKALKGAIKILKKELNSREYSNMSMEPQDDMDY